MEETQPQTSQPDIVFKPQPGPQEIFLGTDADIAIYGGSAGSGKTYALLLDPLRFAENEEFNGVIFRRLSTDVTAQGGIWGQSELIYPLFGAKGNYTDHVWTFPVEEGSIKPGAKIGFGHMQYEKNKLKYQGGQIPFIGWEELCQFEESQFWYLYSRNRAGDCRNVRPYMRATCNPDPDSWVKKLILWWLDENGEYPDYSKSGVLRWFIRDNNEIIWADTEEELKEKYPAFFEDPVNRATSFTFIPAKLDDNQKLMQKDPGYKSKLLALPLVERMQLLGGNWKVKATAGNVFKRTWFGTALYNLPPNIIRVIRYWDRAGTKKKEKSKSHDPDYTAGVLMCRTAQNNYMVLDVKTMRGRPGEVKNFISKVAEQDRENFGFIYEIGIEQDPGQAGISEKDDYIKLLTGYNVRAYPARQDKIVRAKPFSAQCEAGNVSTLKGDWNEAYLDELEAFPDGTHDDMVDASSGAFNAIAGAVDPFAAYK